MALGTKDQISGAKQDIVSVPYFTVLDFCYPIKLIAWPKVVWNICVKMEDISHDTWRKIVKKLVKFNS